MLTGPVAQWDLYDADLEPTIGREQAGKYRPVLVVSNDGFNGQYDIVTVLPLTSLEGKKRKIYPFELLLAAGAAGNSVDSIVMPQQIRTISKLRLLERLGSPADIEIRRDIEDKILQHLGIDLDDPGE